MAGALIDRSAFEARLAELERTCDATAGIFGPASVMWEIGRESSSFLGAGAALLLQTAHPWIAQAVADHSKALQDPLGRFRRTFRPVFSMVYGSRDQALAQARIVRGVHDRIYGTMPETVGRFAAGTAYAANDPDALFWVHATLWHTSIAVRERMMGPLPQPVKDQYNEETGRFAALFGIPAASLPPSWAAFSARFAEIAFSDTIGLGRAGRMIGAYFLGNGNLGRLVPAWYRAVTASLLPAPIAAAFGLELPSSIDRLWARIARTYLKLPPALRTISPYQEAMRRIDGRGPSLWTRAMSHIVLGRPRLEPVP